MRIVLSSLAVIAALCSTTVAQVATVIENSSATTTTTTHEGDWLVKRDERTGITLRTRELLLHPKAESQPALKHRLIPDPFDRTDGNAAIFYLKALGFFEETRARLEIEKFEREAREQNEESSNSDVAPHSWYSMPLKDLPVAEVKKFMQLLDFQTYYLREATTRKGFSLDRNIRAVRSPILYGLPEIQVMRNLARMQRIRVRLAIVENRIDDAIEFQGQQYALAAHLGTDEFVVSNLVGAGIASMAWDDALHLVEHVETPNLYWSFAALPKPLIDMKNAMSYERQFLFEQVKSLREVDETHRPAGYWLSHLDRIAEDLRPIFAWELGIRVDDDEEVERAQLVTFIAAAYPGSVQYLVKECKLDLETVRSYPQLQTVLLATRRYYERTRDVHYKWQFLDYADANRSPLRQQNEQQLRRSTAELGWSAQPTQALLSTMQSIRTAQQRVQQHLAMLQTVESIRQYASNHDRRLPGRLDDLSLPAPVDPISGEPLIYEHNGDNATITSAQTPGTKYRLILRIAK